VPLVDLGRAAQWNAAEPGPAADSDGAGLVVADLVRTDGLSERDP